MADIQSYLDNIKSAVYGEDVRDSIHDAIKKVNDDNDSYISIKEEILNAQEEINQEVETFDGIKDEFNQIKDDFNQAKDDFGDIRDELNSKSDELANQLLQATESVQTLETLNSESDGLSESLSSLIETGKTLKSDLTVENQVTTDNLSTVETLKSDIVDLKQQFESLIESSQSSKSDLDNAVTQALKVLEQLQNTIVDYEQILAGLDGKVDKREGYTLSKNDFTDEYKSKVDANTLALEGLAALLEELI